MWYFLWFIIKLQKHVNCLYSMMLGSGPNLGNKFFTKNFLLLTIFGSLVLNLSGILSTWTFELPPTYLTWTIVDIWPTTHPPNLVHVVFEWPLNPFWNLRLQLPLDQNYSEHNNSQGFRTPKKELESVVQDTLLLSFRCIWQTFVPFY